MSVLVNAVFRENPRNREEGGYYLTPKHRTPITRREIIEAISKRTGMSKFDANLVISALAEIIPEYLKNGHNVHLGDMGTFSLNISSAKSETPEGATVETIKSTKVRFLPSAIMKDGIRDVTFMIINK